MTDVIERECYKVVKLARLPHCKLNLNVYKRFWSILHSSFLSGQNEKC